jgi:hypothetical protein
LVDDGSDLIDKNIETSGLDVEIIELRYKMGHQKAINHGLNYLIRKFPGVNAVTLDGDGEDEPADAILMAQKLLNDPSVNVVAARRLSRQNGFLFAFSSRIFRILFKRTTGYDLRSGNFLGIRGNYVPIITEFPALNNHVAASIIRYATRIEFMDFNRGSRISGKSQMNLPRLFLHAYGAFAVFADILIVRFIIFLLIFSVLTFISSGLFVAAKIFGIFKAIPGWTSLIFVQVISTIFLISSISLLILFIYMKLERSKE